MRGPGIVIAVYGLVVLTTAIITYVTAGSVSFLIAGSASGLLLLTAGLGVLRGKKMGFLIAPILTVLLTAFFGYRFAESGEIIPSGLMAAIGLGAVILYFALPPKEIL